MIDFYSRETIGGTGNMIDLYNLLPQEWFEQIGDFSSDRYKYEPIDYEKVAYALYEGNSFFCGEFADLYVDEELKTYYICSGIIQPIGDYARETIWAWYKSDVDKYEQISKIINEALKRLEELKNG